MAEDLVSLISRQVNVLEEEGYKYLQQWGTGFFVPERVKLPDGRIYDAKELSEQKNSNPSDQMLLKAKMLLDLYSLEGYEGKRYDEPSFIDDEDEEQARRKYSNKK